MCKYVYTLSHSHRGITKKNDYMFVLGNIELAYRMKHNFSDYNIQTLLFEPKYRYHHKTQFEFGDTHKYINGPTLSINETSLLLRVSHTLTNMDSV